MRQGFALDFLTVTTFLALSSLLTPDFSSDSRANVPNLEFFSNAAVNRAERLSAEP